MRSLALASGVAREPLGRITSRRASRFCARPAGFRRTSPGRSATPLGFQQTDSGRVLRLRSPRARGLHDRRRRGDEDRRQSAPSRGACSIPRAFDLDPSRRQLRRRRRAAPAAAHPDVHRRAAAGSAASRCRRASAARIDARHRRAERHRRRSSTPASNILINQPESGRAHLGARARTATPRRTFGQLRPTGPRGRPERAPRAERRAAARRSRPAGSTSSSSPACRCSASTTRRARSLFERHVEGPEMDEYLRTMPTRWPTRRTEDGDVLPLVPPAIRTAGVDRAGTAVDRADAAVHLRLRRRAATRSARCSSRAPTSLTPEQPVLHEGRPHPGHAGLLRVPHRLIPDARHERSRHEVTKSPDHDGLACAERDPRRVS